MNRTMCSWCNKMNDVIPFAKSNCFECGHNFELSRMDCDCRVCQVRREMVQSVQYLLRRRDDRTQFDATWSVLAKSGGCDRKGSLEYYRVAEVFETVGIWGVVEEFILRHANTIVPQEPQPKPDTSAAIDPGDLGEIDFGHGREQP